MASLDLDENRATYQIQSYQTGMVKINNITYTQSLIIAPNQLIENWAPQVVADLNPTSLVAILPFKPDILIIGTGPHLIFPPAEIYGELINAGIGVEIMNTGAACRTYNALSSENRQVMAALLLK